MRASKDGSIRTNLDMCPGNHEDGTGRGGIWRRARAIFKVAGECLKDSTKRTVEVVFFIEYLMVFS